MILKEEAYGRTPEQLLTKLKWKPVQSLYNSAVIKFTNKILNNQDLLYFQSHFTTNRSVRRESEKKIAQYPVGFGTSKETRSLFRYRAHNLYNTLPPNLTKARNHIIFKKWFNKYYWNPKMKIPDLS